MNDPNVTCRTGEVAATISGRLGVRVTEAQLNAVLRRRPDLAPPLVAGRRAWRQTDVEAVTRLLGSRVATAAHGGSNVSE